MISFPAYYLMVLYGLIGVPLLIISLVHLYHAFRFGSASPQSIISSGIYVAGLVLILAVTYGYLHSVSPQDSLILNLPIDQWLPHG